MISMSPRLQTLTIHHYLGLSLLFFILSLMGNLTYGAGVSSIFYSGYSLIHNRGLTSVPLPDPLPLYRKRLCGNQSPMVDRVARHHSRGCHNFRTVPPVRKRTRTNLRNSSLASDLTCNIARQHDEIGGSLPVIVLFLSIIYLHRL